MSKNPREDVYLPGKLLVFEGIDRSGKSTQLKLLSQRLTDEGINHRLLKFPYYETDCGKTLAAHLSSHGAVRSRRAIHLLFSANRWEMMKDIVNSLVSGTHVLVDRYAFSGVAYSVGAENLSYDWCIVPDDGLLSPDIVIYLDNPAHVSAMRSNFGMERYEKECKLEAVRHVYDQFSKLPYWQSFDATLPEKELSDVVYEKVKDVLNSEPRRLYDAELHFPKDLELDRKKSVHLVPPFV
ncbi:putative thymidylate kinase [Babesia sp. Xinjiang]|uniref:putative thymidylate kinase n=1 Tax=Babesia sp. Xinjiang TaxID=462227 RepID=UPI000A25BB8E|nr:putative thymidylate kinase [Babesia sp. Xinjiang]ORM41910.1 putative thymidylate kinase [Babesia sp. Xinjiang]